MAVAVGSLAALALVVGACAGSADGVRTTTTSVAAFDALDCGSGDTVAGVGLVTDITTADSRLSILRCAVEVTSAQLGDGVAPVDVVAGATVDSLGALMVRLDPTLTIDEVAEAMTRIESAVFTAPTAVAVDLARVRADAVAAPTERWLLTTDVAHELFHVLQWRLSGGDAAATRRLAAEPFWLVEAAPTWFADSAMSSTAFDADRQAVAAQVIERAGGFPGLDRWETAAGFGTWDPPASRLPTALRFAALVEVGELLAQRAGRAALEHDYWVERARTDEPWPVTFDRVFGMSVAEFYAEVDRHFATAAATGSFD